ncbi:hypothetical protein BaRGS_00000551 [Batillaria attramentaria]|uniref:Uncharacterized protein n=1 Tax=Batillaria attramentaria TaxID=370345 RepID=A0ABD0M9R5_9CAEN
MTGHLVQRRLFAVSTQRHLKQETEHDGTSSKMFLGLRAGPTRHAAIGLIIVPVPSVQMKQQPVCHIAILENLESSNTGTPP